jgi:hypothetical protein
MPNELSAVPRSPKTSVIKPYRFSHGTCECHDIAETRRFLEELLGLDCVQIAPTRSSSRLA